MTLIALLSLVACSTQEAAPSAEDHRLQRTRSGYSTSGSMVSTHLLLRDTAGEAIACGPNTDLSVTVQVSQDGPNGPWVSATNDIQVRCSESPSGDLAMVLDNSGSTAEVVQTLRDSSSSLMSDVIGADGRASLVRVSTNASVLHDLTDDEASLDASIQSGLIDGSNGWTALWDGVRMGNETFGGAAVDRDGAVTWTDLDSFCGASDRLGIVVFTDGNENNSADEQDYDHDSYPGDGYDTNLDDLKGLHVAGQSTPIYTVGLGDDVDHATLTDLATSTGGAHTPITDASEIGPVFDQIGSWMSSTHQVCASLPETVCGGSHVKVDWTLRDQAGSVLDTGSMVQGVTMECPAEPPTGRKAVVLLTLTNPRLPATEVTTFVENTVNWVTPVFSPNVLVVLDDNHHNEFLSDAADIAATMNGIGIAATYMDEPPNGLSASDLAGYDVVWFANPGYPPDDLASIQALAAFNAAGGGLVLQGDDMTWSAGNAFSMSQITGLDHVNNGVRTCGQTTDNNRGASFSIDVTNPHPLFGGITSTSWLYGDDIDVSTPNGQAQVVATADLDGQACQPRPTVVVTDPNAAP